MSGVRLEVSIVQLEVGVLPAEHLHQRDQVVGGEAGVEAHPDLPVLAGPGVARGQPGVLQRPSADRHGARKASPASVSCTERLLRSKSLTPKVLFQIHDLLADRRLGDVQPFRGTSVVQFLRDRDERRQPSQLHADLLS